MKKLTITLFFILISIVPSRNVYCLSVSLMWDRNTESDIKGYKVYYGTSSRAYTSVLDIPSPEKTTATVYGLLPNSKYYFAATAYNNYQESLYSEEISFSTGSITTTTTTVLQSSDCLVKSVVMEEDYGYTGRFVIDLSDELGNQQLGFFGQSEPNGGWMDYPVNQRQVVIPSWPKGAGIEFSLYSVGCSGKQYFDPKCSEFLYPEYAKPEDQRLRVILGEKTVCEEQELDDKLVIKVLHLGGSLYRVYVDFTILPIENYRKIFVLGQSAPDKAWKNYDVVDDSPCFHFDVYWADPESYFHFSGGVIKENGLQQWFDTNPSGYFCDGHLCIRLGDFN